MTGSLIEMIISQVFKIWFRYASYSCSVYYPDFSNVCFEESSWPDCCSSHSRYTYRDHFAQSIKTKPSIAILSVLKRCRLMKYPNTMHVLPSSPFPKLLTSCLLSDS